MEMNYELLQRRLAYIKGYLHNINPQLNEAYQEETAELIWTIEEDIKQLEAILLQQQKAERELERQSLINLAEHYKGSLIGDELAKRLDIMDEADLNALENQSPEQ